MLAPQDDDQPKVRRMIMLKRSSAGVVALGSALIVSSMLTTAAAAAEAGAKYPSWKGLWAHSVNREVEVQGAFDQTKAWGPGQQAPLTMEYQKVLQKSMEDQANGGLGNYPTAQCLPSGMPRIMTFGSQEYVITPETTYILLSGSDHLRRIFTDGRDWPKNPIPTYGGYSIGRWIDTDGDGTYDLLEAETRYFKGPRAFDATGLPLAFDNQSIFKEMFFIDRNNPDVIHDFTTVIDHALTRPWNSDRRFDRRESSVVQWPETWCQEGNANIVIGKENYFLRADGLLMPAKKNQTPPDLRYFNQTAK
jgi:hypothetical protein